MKIKKREKIYIFGAGGNASVIYETLNKKYLIDGLILTNINEKINDIRYKKTKLINENEFLKNYSDVNVVITVGENYIRKKIFKKLSRKKFKFPNIIHKSSIIDASANLGHGNIIMPNTVINANANLENLCIINTSVILEHDTDIRSFCSISPNSVVCGYTKIDEGVFIGANSTIIHKLSIGSWSVVGAGSLIVKNTHPQRLYFGNPAKMIKKIEKSKKIL